MNNEILEDIFESMLKAAVYENSEREAAVFLTKPFFHIPLASAKTARRNMKWFYYRNKLVVGYKYGRKCAIVALITMGTAVGALLVTSQEVRASLYNAIIEIYEEFIEFRINQSRTSSIDYEYEFGYLPEGYVETDVIEMDDMLKKIYKNKAGDKIELLVLFGGASTHNSDQEGFKVVSCLINGYEGSLFISEGEKNNKIVWSTSDAVISIKAPLNISELKKIAKFLK